MAGDCHFLFDNFVTIRFIYNHKVIMYPDGTTETEMKIKDLYIANLNFQSLEVVSRYRDPQLQVGGNYS